MSVQINKTTPIKFQANDNYQISYNNRFTPPMPEANPMDDVFMMQAMEQQKAAKKEKSKENWNKAGVIAQIGIAVGFITTAGIALLGFLGMKGKGGAANNATKNLKLEWKNIAKDTKFPKLEDDCVNPKVRNFINSIKNATKLSDAAKKAAGVKGEEQCILMYGPAGTGKTFSAKMLAKELGAEYTEVQFADVSSPFIGQTSVEIQNAFKQIKKQAEKNPDKKFVVGFNEIDSLLVPREKCGANNLHLAENRTAFLNGLDDIANLSNIKIVGTTNVHPESGNLDKASLSRFKNMIEIELPTEKELKAALEFHFKDAENVVKHKFFENNKTTVNAFVKKLRENKYSQRDVEDIVKKASSEFAIDINNSKNIANEKFDIKYLEKAFDLKGPTTGSIAGEPIPGWQNIKAPTEQISLAEAMRKKTTSWMDKFKSLFSNKNE